MQSNRTSRSVDRPDRRSPRPSGPSIHLVVHAARTTVRRQGAKPAWLEQLPVGP